MKPQNIDLSNLSIYIFFIDGAVECFVYTTPSNGVNLIFKFSVIRHPRKKSHTRGKGRVASFLRMAPVQPFSRWQTAFLPLKSITLCVLTHTVWLEEHLRSQFSIFFKSHKKLDICAFMQKALMAFAKILRHRGARP